MLSTVAAEFGSVSGVTVEPEGGVAPVTWQEPQIVGDSGVSDGETLANPSDRASLSNVLFNPDLPIAAKEYAFGEGVRPGGNITIGIDHLLGTWTSGGVTIGAWLGEVLSHELGHGLGLEDSYMGAGTPVAPYDIMSGFSSLAVPAVAPVHIDTIEAALGLELFPPEPVAPPAIENYEADFNLPTSGTAPLKGPPLGGNADVAAFGVSGSGQDFLSGDTFDFGVVLADGRGGQSAALEFSLRNLGSLPITINSAALTLGDAGFSIAGANPAGTTLAVGQSVALTLLFDPSQAGTAGDTLSIVTTASATPFALQLSGKGLTTAGQISLTLPTDLASGLGMNNFGGVELGQSKGVSQFGTITNTGGGTLSISNIVATDGADYTVGGLPAGFGPNNPVLVQPGQSFHFDLTFSPQHVGLAAGEIQVVTNDPNTPVSHQAVVGTALPATGAAPHWGDDFVMITVGATAPQRFRSDVNGRFHWYLPPTTPYELSVYDPDSGLIWHTAGTSAVGGQFTDFGLPAFIASTAPASQGALPDDIAAVMGPGHFFDFGTATSPTAPGYTPVTATTAYSQTLGYGWQFATGQTGVGVDRVPTASTSVSAQNALKRDFVSVSDGTFAVDLPNGGYDVTVTLGDALDPDNLMQVEVQGFRAGAISTRAGEFVVNTYQALVVNGQLLIRFQGEGGGTVALDGLEITPSATPVTAHGALSDAVGLYYFAIENLNTGFVMRNSVVVPVGGGPLCPTGPFLAPNTPYREYALHASDLTIGVSDFTSTPSGTFTMPNIQLGPDTSPDNDGDGLSNLAEYVVGTDPNKFSTTGDGIGDAFKVQQGLDPLGYRPVATGVVASLDLQGEAQQVVLGGSILDAQQETAFVATGSYGLAIVNASQFTRPTVLGQIRLPGDATGVSVDDNLKLAVVADGAGGLAMVDVSDPTQPKVTRTISVDATLVVAVDGVAYAAVSSQLFSYDMLTGERLQVLSLSGASLTGLARDGMLLYTMDSADTLRVVDISSLLMVARGSLALPQGGGKLFVGGGVADVAAADYVYGGYETVDVSNPDAPKLIAGTSAAQTAAAPGPIVVSNGSGIALVANGAVRGTIAGVQVFDASDPTKTGSFLTDFPLPASPNDIATGAGIGFVADGPAGLQVVNYLPFDARGVAPLVTLDTSGLDIDTVTPGIQVAEGSEITLKAAISDDVQVRNVEVVVNGLVVKTDVSFPFDLSTFLPSIAVAGDSVTVQVSATDTGGNTTTTTAPLTLDLVPDTVPPGIVQINPADGAVRGQEFRAVTIDFSKPIDPTTVAADTFTLVGPGGAIALEDVEFRLRNTEVQLTLPPGTLAAGDYQLVINAPELKDMAGNELGAASITSSFTIAQYSDVWINAAGGDWNTASNWDSGKVPGPNDDVLIDVPGGVTIIHGSGTSVIRSLLSEDGFTLSGGSLSASQSIEVDGVFTLAGGTLLDTLVLAGSSGQGIVFTTSGGLLDGVTADGDLDLTHDYRDFAYVRDGLVLNGTARLGDANGHFGQLFFTGTQSLAGAGSVVFGNSSSNALYVTDGATTLTIGPAITIHGQSGYVYGAGNTSIVNQGTILADVAAGTINIQPTTFTNQGTVGAKNGGTLSLYNSWNNAGVISVDNTSTLNLGGSFTWAGLGTLNRSGGSVNVTGTLDATNALMALDAATGSFNLLGGTIKGGTITEADGALLVFTTSSGLLDGVTADGDLDLTHDYRDFAYVRDGLVLNGTARLGDANGHFGQLFFTGTQSLAGAGSVVFGNSSSNALYVTDGATTLTIGPAITIHGQTGNVYGAGGTSITNNGTILSDVAAGTINIQPTTFTNQGTVGAKNGGTLAIYNLAAPMAGTITAGAGGTDAVNGGLTLSSASTVNVELAGTTSDKFGRLTVSGAAAFDGTLNISLVNGYQPVSGDSFKVMTFASETGQFATINGTSIPNNLVLAAAYDTADLTLVAGQALMAAAGLARPSDNVDALTAAEAAPLVLAAVDRWAAAGLDPLSQAGLSSSFAVFARQFRSN
ncbi:MAG TPA: choice-of-anchor D domain-containing protein [Pirellulales bacterium]|nr:choice-of-anchor D domain-containing protein [Pirellulales bacterium]